MNWIRKIIYVSLVICLSGTATLCHAQSWAEIFNQKKTQKKYLLQQIAALEVYTGYLKKGYQMVDGSLTTIRDITNGEFKLHDAFIGSLKQVSPAIGNDTRIAEVIALQIAILKAFGNIKGNDFLSAKNVAYVSLVTDGVIAACYNDLEELLLVITSGNLEMKDDQRLERLDRVYKNMLDKSVFTQDFTGNVIQLIRQRQSEQKEIIRMHHIKERR